MTFVYGIQSVLPKNRYGQAEITAEFIKQSASTDLNPKLIDRFHKSVCVQTRHLALPLEAYAKLSNFTQKNHIFREAALELGVLCIEKLLQKTGFHAKDIHQIIFTTVTGLCVPSIDASLVNRLGFSKHIKRVPLFGLGCLAGAAGIARAHDYIVGHPHETVLLLAVELCSLTVQKDDGSLANLVASGLFADGAAAVLLGGKTKPGSLLPRILDSESVFFENTEYIMGWDIGQEGFKIILSADVPRIAETELPPAIDHFLQKHSLCRQDIQHWIAHPGGPKVIDALERGLGVQTGSLDMSRRSLEQIGNLSSVSVLRIFEKCLQIKKPKKGDKGLLFAMGPGFCTELVLLAW